MQTTGFCRRQSPIQSFVFTLLHVFAEKLRVGNGLLEIGAFGVADHVIFVLPCCPAAVRFEQPRRTISLNIDP
jgi:hypothetical protein